MSEISIAFDGSQRCTATHHASDVSLVTDALSDTPGQGASFSPADLLAAALGTCILTTIATAARHRGIDLAGGRVSVKKEMVTRPARRIGTLSVEIMVPLDLPDEQRTALEWAAKSSPVYRSVHPDVEVSIAFVWGHSPVPSLTIVRD